MSLFLANYLFNTCVYLQAPSISPFTASTYRLKGDLMRKSIEEGITLHLLFSLPINSMAPTRSRSSSCRIVESTKVGYLMDVDGLASANSLAPARGRMVAVVRDIRVGMGGLGCDLANVLDGIGVEAIGGMENFP